MKRNSIKEFPQPDGSTAICEIRDGVRLPTRYVQPEEPREESSAVKQESRRIVPERTFTQKAANFVSSAVKHVAAGMPHATDEQVAQRFAICQECPHYIAQGEQQGECSKCGCGIKAVGVGAGISKLRWADQSCPLGKWKPLPPAQPGG